jgi:hypothetical protein
MPDDATQRRKNLTLLCVLLGLAVVLFCVTIVKVGSNGATGG